MPWAARHVGEVGCPGQGAPGEGTEYAAGIDAAGLAGLVRRGRLAVVAAAGVRQGVGLPVELLLQSAVPAAQMKRPPADCNKVTCKHKVKIDVFSLFSCHAVLCCVDFAVVPERREHVRNWHDKI